MRRTASLLMEIAKARAICYAIRGQPHVGFRRFISTTAAMISSVGPLGPGLVGIVDEKIRRYLRCVRARCRRKAVDGLKTIAQ
jgi:hypothetical protein